MASRLEQLSVPGELYRSLPDSDRIQCFACGHQCKILPGKHGICRVRYNNNGILMVPSGYVGAWQCDPIEKKPFFHCYPNTLAMSFGMLGCDLKCGYCQNWQISQTLRDPESGTDPREVSPEVFVDSALKYNARSVVSTYNEPLITAEWSKQIFQVARKQGLATGFVSNGNATDEAIEFIGPHLDMYKVDLKAFSQKGYQSLGGNLEKILHGIEVIKSHGIWLEIVTLVVPGLNDSPNELQAIAEFIASVDVNTPWHVTAFHPDYKMQDRNRTKAATLLDAARIGQKAGLNFIYAGNLPYEVGKWQDTNCQECGTLLIERSGFAMLGYHLTTDSRCPNCDVRVPGIWETPPVSRRNLFVL